MVEEERHNKYLETDEIIREAYNQYARKYDLRPTQEKIANICGMSRKTISIHLRENPFFMDPKWRKNIKKRVEEEGPNEKKRYPSPQKEIMGNKHQK